MRVEKLVDTSTLKITGSNNYIGIPTAKNLHLSPMCYSGVLTQTSETIHFII